MSKNITKITSDILPGEKIDCIAYACTSGTIATGFNNIKKNTLFISTYHDQALIPFKILNKKGINMTLGLNYRRMSPAHGTAKDIKYKNVSDNSSFVECMIN